LAHSIFPNAGQKHGTARKRVVVYGSFDPKALADLRSKMRTRPKKVGANPEDDVATADRIAQANKMHRLGIGLV
jgi:hypothetical protein